MLDEQPTLHPKIHYKKIMMPFMIIVLIILAIYLGVLIRNELKEYNYIGKSPEFQDRVTIEGTGKVTVTPDIAVVNVGIIIEKTTVEAAQTESTEKMNDIIAVLKKDYQIEERDIKTSQYQINPSYDWSNDRRTIIGYSVSQTVEVKVRDFEKIGEIISMAGSKGSNSVSGPSFTIDDPEVYKEEARAKAIDQAKEKAKTLANQVGINLGPIVNFSENGAVPVYDNYYAKSMDTAVGMGGAGEISPSIEAGSQEVSMTVSISYEIR